jgi:hypothetical protein
MQSVVAADNIPVRKKGGMILMLPSQKLRKIHIEHAQQQASFLLIYITFRNTIVMAIATAREVFDKPTAISALHCGA